MIYDKENNENLTKKIAFWGRVFVSVAQMRWVVLLMGADSALDLPSGWLYKWTNYLKGYRKRWFVLENGLFSYYR